MTASVPIGVVHYGVGNVASVCNSLNRIGVPWTAVETPEDVSASRKLLLPGVGAFGAAMQKMRSQGLDEAIVRRVRQGDCQLLGVCLGMQLMFEHSEEGGSHEGLALIPGHVSLLDDSFPDIPIPHIGWNSVRVRGESRLLVGCGPDPDFYFVHSFRCVSADRALVSGVCTHGGDFDAVVESGNVMGCQFHPEKSQKNGLTVLANFAALPC